MSSSQTPILDARDAALVVADLVALQPAFTPELPVNRRGSQWALAQIFGKYLQSVIERLNQAPDKNKLAFLDLMGVSLLPAQAARAPLVFTPILSTGNSRVPERTRAGAKLPDSSSPLVFETEQAIALAAAPLVEVVSVIPAHDSYADHSTALVHGDSFRLFSPERPVLHRLYLAHGGFLALAGEATVEVRFDLATAGNKPLDIQWEFWNGKTWQHFDTMDLTAGLTHSGVVRLVNASGNAEKTAISGVNSYWIRGHLKTPLPPDPSRVLPMAQRIQVSCDIVRPLRYAVIRTVQTASGPVKEMGAVGDILPDQAYSEGAKLDVSTSFYPLGKSPDRNSAFYFTNHEVFSKAGAHVTLAFRKSRTPEEQADELAAAALVDEATKAILKAVADLAKVALDAGQTLVPVVVALQADPTYIEQALSNLKGAVSSLKVVKDLPHLVNCVHALADAMAQQYSDENLGWDYFHNCLTTAANDTSPLLADLAAVWPPITLAHRHFVTTAAQLAGQILTDLAWDLINYSDQDFGGGFAELAVAVAPYAAAVGAITDDNTMNAANGLVGAVLDAFPNVGTPWPTVVQALYLSMTQKVSRVDQAVSTLAALAATPGAGTKDPDPPKLDPPRLVWEYCSATGWKALLGPADDPGLNFQRSGEVHFTVPSDFLESSVQNIDGLWMRVRLDTGSYQILRVMTWSDPTTHVVNTMAILEQRPPALEGFFLGYHYTSPHAAPEHAFTLNDFQYEDQTPGAAGPGQPFAPYHPVSDTTPALYLGFDGALPADLIGMYFALPESQQETTPIPVKWECFDGTGWSAITVNDETEGLVLPGIVSAVWPGVPAPPSATVTSAKDLQAVVSDPRQAARFRPGQQLYISQNGAGELVTLASLAHDTLTFTAELSRTYSNASIQVAVMPRFGTPRSWIRVRLQQAIDPPNPRVDGIYANAVWASQKETNQNETLGGSNGEPGQAFFTRQRPVLEDEVIEVRELDGARAAVELPMLRDDLAKQGMSEADLRIVTDPRSGDITQVWVRWRIKPNLLFSGPDDRDLTLERTAGRLILGDGVHGRIPPAGPDDIRAAEYRSGGGVIGNVPKGSITQLLSGVTAQSVTNPRVAEAGADGETVAQVLERGPLVMRHRYQAVARLDYEAMAQQASPGVAVARAHPTTHPSGHPAPGWVTLVVVPQSTDRQPQPTFDLRKQVHDYIARRAPASLEGLAVIGPVYLPVGVTVEISPRNPSDAGPVGSRVRDALTAFLHPLTGGPDGQGWPFGRSVYLSDVASLVESIDGVDFASSIDLLIQNTPVGEVAVVPENRMVAAGVVRVILGGLEV